MLGGCVPKRTPRRRRAGRASGRPIDSSPEADYCKVNHLLAWLTDNVRNAAAKCGAHGASVYVPTPWNDAAPGLLVHVGAEPLPEMIDLEGARAFARQADAWYGDRATNQRELAVLPSESPGGC